MYSCLVENMGLSGDFRAHDVDWGGQLMKLYFNSFTYLFIYQVTGLNSLSDDELGFGMQRHGIVVPVLVEELERWCSTVC